MCIRDRSKDKATTKMLKRVAEDVDGGYSMAAAFEKNAPHLPRTFIETVRAGEQSGALEICFKRLHKYYDKSAKLKQKLISTMTYPAIVIATAIIVFIIIMVVAVPMFIDTFEELNIELPAITKAMIALSRALTGYWLSLIHICNLRISLPETGRQCLLGADAQFAFHPGGGQRLRPAGRCA